MNVGKEESVFFSCMNTSISIILQGCTCPGSVEQHKLDLCFVLFCFVSSCFVFREKGKREEGKRREDGEKIREAELGR